MQTCRCRNRCVVPHLGGPTSCRQIEKITLLDNNINNKYSKNEHVVVIYANYEIIVYSNHQNYLKLNTFKNCTITNRLISIFALNILCLEMVTSIFTFSIIRLLQYSNIRYIRNSIIPVLEYFDYSNKYPELTSSPFKYTHSKPKIYSNIPLKFPKVQLLHYSITQIFEYVILTSPLFFKFNSKIGTSLKNGGGHVTGNRNGPKAAVYRYFQRYIGIKPNDTCDSCMWEDYVRFCVSRWVCHWSTDCENYIILDLVAYIRCQITEYCANCTQAYTQSAEMSMKSSDFVETNSWPTEWARLNAQTSEMAK